MFLRGTSDEDFAMDDQGKQQGPPVPPWAARARYLTVLGILRDAASREQDRVQVGDMGDNSEQFLKTMLRVVEVGNDYRDAGSVLASHS